jgi:polysaccharide biosynthesis protein PslH
VATILTIIPYSFFPPIGGGALRCFHLLKQVAQHHEVYVLTNQNEGDFKVEFCPVFPKNVTIVSYAKGVKYRSLFNVLPERLADALNFRILTGSVKGPTNTGLLQVLPTLINLVNNVNFDLILYENLEALKELSTIINSLNKTAVHLYDAHNCDSELWMQLANTSKGSSTYTKYKQYASEAACIESTLYTRVDGFMCCSVTDYDKFILLNNKKLSGIIVPNGVDLLQRPFDVNQNKFRIQNLIFCGSLDYIPNKQGLIWFYKTVYPILKQNMPQMSLTVIGNLTSTEDYSDLIEDSSVNFIGKVDNVVPFYKEASVAVVPLKSGSGTRLKILEAMSMGNPVVSTTIGADGIDYKNGQDLLIADTPDDFAKQILSLLADKDLFETLRLSSYNLVELKYNWDKIGEGVNCYLDKLLAQSQGR